MAQFFDLTTVARNNYAYTVTVTQNANMISHIRPANSGEISNFATAASAVIVQDVTYFQPTYRTYLSALTPTAIKALIAA